MTTLAEKLAKTFVKAAHEKRAAAGAVRPRVFSPEDIPGAFNTDDSGLRREFEDSLRHEEILRDKALEYSRLARQRAQDQQGGGVEFLKRLGPLPYSGGEAAWHVPVEAAGGVGGYMLGNRLGGAGMADPTEVAKVLKFTQSKGGKGTIPLAEQLALLRFSRANKAIPATAQKATSKLLAGIPIKDMSTLVSRGAAKGEAASAMAKLEAKGVTRDMLQEAYLRAASEAENKFRIPGRLARWGGAGGGFLAAGALTGLPMAIRGAALRRSGGELAQGARKRILRSVEQAELEQFKRDNLLRTLKGEAPIPMTEWKAQRKQLRQDWRSSTKDYRAVAKARRQGMRAHGTHVPPLPPTEEKA
jgi:hypothetical protein